MTNDETSIDVSEDMKSALRTLAKPVRIAVFTAAGCPHCPHAVRAANTLASLSPNITANIIDIETSPEQARRFNIRSVPMTVIDDDLLINHVVTAAQLAERILSRSRDEFSAEALLSQVETNNIEMASRTLCTRGHAAGAFLSAWKASTLSSRMGLMLVAANALEESPHVLDEIVQRLIAVLATNDTAMRGDTADLLGQIGHEDARKPLEALLRDSNEDIVEIAEEALQRLEERNG